MPERYYRILGSIRLAYEADNLQESLSRELDMIKKSMYSANFLPRLNFEKQNFVLSYVPVKVEFDCKKTSNYDGGLFLKVEQFPDLLWHTTLSIDCLLPYAGGLKVESCNEAIWALLDKYYDKLLTDPSQMFRPYHVLCESAPGGIKTEVLAMNPDGSQPLIHTLSDIWSLDPGSHLINPHSAVPAPNTHDDERLSETAFVSGFYRYFHYTEDGINDSGWGCAYRSLQTLCSWFRMQGYTTHSEPTHRQIQQILVDIGDKPKKFVGSTEWIGSFEVGYVLENYLHVHSRNLNVSSGDELDTLASNLIHHFRHDGTPVMIGGGAYAYTIIGVHLDRSKGTVQYLILDPHYQNAALASIEDDLRQIVCKGWVGWKNSNFWKKGEFYNLCLPLCPKQE